MQSIALVRALLPIALIVACNGCGGGGGGSGSMAATTPTGGSAPPVPTAPSAPPAAPAENRAPTITGQAAALARVGADYEFQPVSADADGDRLSFAATNLPPWATLDATNGRITGRPELSDVGEYDSISITVADASHQTQSAQFSITVTGPASGVAALVWQAPVSKVDGSPLDDLAGYRIVYGREADDLDHSVLLMDPNVTSFEFSTLDSGTWYFAVVAVNASGLEGPPTQAAMKTI